MDRIHLCSRDEGKSWDFKWGLYFRVSCSKRAVQMFVRNIGWVKIEVGDWIHSTRTSNSKVKSTWDSSRFPWGNLLQEKSRFSTSQKSRATRYTALYGFTLWKESLKLGSSCGNSPIIRGLILREELAKQPVSLAHFAATCLMCRNEGIHGEPWAVS